MTDTVVDKKSLPQAVLRSFFFIRKALHWQKYAAVWAMARKYSRLQPEYRGYFEEIAALAQKECGNLTEAIELLHKVHAFFEKKNIPVICNLAQALREAHRQDEAQSLLQEALQEFSDNTRLQSAYWQTRQAQGHLQEALEGFRLLCTEDPTGAHYARLASCAHDVGEHLECMAAFEKNHELSPRDADSWSNHIFIAHYMPEYTAEELRLLLRRWHDALAPLLPPTPALKLERDKEPARPLRIGIISAGLSLHPVGWMASRSLHLLSALGQYQFFFYNTSQQALVPSDPFRMLFEASSTAWYDAGFWPQEKLYARILEDKLDIMLDMAGHTDGCRAHFFIQRVAPLQIKWVGGLFNTSGIAQMDYLLSDELETPAGVDSMYTEKIIRLPHSYVSYSPPIYDENTVPSPSPRSHPDGQICFGCFNNSYKVNHVIVEAWARILHDVPGSTLYLKCSKLGGEEARQRIRNLFAVHGIGAERLRLEGRAPHPQLMKSYHDVDIALDTWPYTGGLTTLEALWMGVPVITTPGPTFAGRHALSHLHNVGLEEFVAENLDAYVALAVELAHHPEVLDDLRPVLRSHILNSPLLDHYQRAADLHTALQMAWQRYCEGLPPMAMRFEQPTPLTDPMRQAWDLA